MAPRQDETTPLLQAPSTPNGGPWRAILCTALTFLLLSIGSHISLAPQTAILQDIICRDYYNSDSLGPDRCKIDAVQSQVAVINGWRDVFESLPAMLLAVPYGTLADRIGRKSVLLLAIAGCFMSDVWIRLVFWFPSFFPVRAVWFAGLWQIIGAGAATLSSVTFVIVADLCPSDQRTTAFSHIQSASLLSQFLFTPVGAVLMVQSPWIPMFISSAFMLVGFGVAVFFVPETLNLQSLQDDTGGGQGGEALPKMSSHHPMLKCWDRARALGRWMAQNARVVVVLSCFYAFHLGEQSGGPLLLQYASKRLGWSLGEASYLLSLRAGINLLVLIFLIPALSSVLLRRFRMREIAKDTLLAQSSSVLLALGSGTIFLAKSWQPLLAGQLLFSLGYAFAVPARSVVTSMVEPRQLGTVYTSIAVLTYAGLLTGGPLLARCFKWGLSMGEAWLGMPFLIACGFFLLSLAAVSLAARQKHDGLSNDAEVGDDGPQDGQGSEGRQ
ncbi:major facilitator superfamily protein [Hirsutella rhossiliensis]|uniref:Major facilitator superfamily domain-containing protein n=1 Tax=Hirsutella rhossiliensis TaxID=111463 RepID=A0A9P8N4Y8_9HYPO|nr:major facilitator superfamily domain-containing protein [Hirsutella rhossiliensis]KAH0964737.1 major facilitator superfamily domain-containing protein [Hirsutella rhossiliensis]